MEFMYPYTECEARFYGVQAQLYELFYTFVFG